MRRVSRLGQISTRMALIGLIGMGVSGSQVGCSRTGNESPAVEVEVVDVTFDRSSGAPVLVLQDKARRGRLPMLIGTFEAQAIAMRLRGVTVPRPLTHDLITNILHQIGAEIDHVLVADLKDNTYYARIYLLNAGKNMVEVDSRPSDAIALALRFEKPIYVMRRLLVESEPPPGRQDVLFQSEQLLGAEIQDLTPELAQYFGTDAGSGALVAQVSAGAAGKLRRGDIILKLNGLELTGVADLKRRLADLGEGKTIELEVERDGHRIIVRSFAGD